MFDIVSRPAAAGQSYYIWVEGEKNIDTSDFPLSTEENIGKVDGCRHV